MDTKEFFENARKAEEGFGDTKQGVFGYLDYENKKCYLSNGIDKVVEVDFNQYRLVDSAFGRVYDADESTSDELTEMLEDAGLIEYPPNKYL